uniref:FBA_2 domain-containing protein n=1 Tax=Caenorhabditis tropicalis TaxID=1561998 RepID=A0A1I7UZR8_9PELO
MLKVVEWLSLDHLLSMDCKEIDMRNDFISNQEVNLFLKSWKEGKTNSRLERIGMKYGYEKVVDWNIILKGLKPKIRDLRTTKYKFMKRSMYRNEYVIWRHGGIDIQRDDGTIGMICLLSFDALEENEEISQIAIDYFEKYRDKDWNSGEVEIEEDTIVEQEARIYGRLARDNYFEMIVFDPKLNSF